MDSDWIGWYALKPEVQAAWVQAIGSILAILVAIAVPLYIRRADKARERRETRRRSKSFALDILPLIESFRTTLIYTRQRLRSERAYLDYENLAADLGMTHELQEMARDLHELGDAAEGVQDAIAHARETGWLLEAQYEYLKHDGVYIHPDGSETKLDEPKDFAPVLDAAIRKINGSIYELHRLFD